MKLSKAYIDPNNKWTLIREGIDTNNRKILIPLAIPPTNGDRIDIITDKDINTRYLIDADIIIIIIQNGNINEIILK